MSTEVMVKDTPLLMKGPLVCATLEDRKTQTRRLNGLDVINRNDGRDSANMWKYKGALEGGPYHLFEYADGISTQTVKCPYGKPGDRLWVREAFKYFQPHGEDGIKRGVEFRADGTLKYVPPLADDEGCLIQSLGKWKPSIHLPRWASRINLEIISIRVERLQDISMHDAFDEGACWTDHHHQGNFEAGSYCVGSFKTLWDSINAKRGYGWDKNPYVWVVEFKRMELPVVMDGVKAVKHLEEGGL